MNKRMIQLRGEEEQSHYTIKIIKYIQLKMLI